MTHPLDGAVLRIQRARTDQQQLDAEIAAARGRSPYQVLLERKGVQMRQRKTRALRVGYAVRARLAESPNPFWGVIAGEIIYNLRCALDYLIYQAAIELSRKDPPPGADQLYFPIVGKASQLRSSPRNRAIMAAIGPRGRALVRRVQPYAHRKDKTLRLLQAFSNHDKHRAAAVTTRAVLSGRIVFTNDSRIGITGVRTRRGPVEDGAEIGSFTATFMGPPGMNMQVSAQFAYNEVFESPPELRGKPVMRTLETIRLFVERTLREANPLFAQRPYEVDADEYRRHMRFRVGKAVVPTVTMTGGCGHWRVEQLTRDGYDLVHRGDPHHAGYQEPELAFEANP